MRSSRISFLPTYSLYLFVSTGKLHQIQQKEILSKQGLTAKTLVPSDSLNEGLLQYVSGTPTTVFFDKNGKQIGDPKVGAFSTHDTDAITELYMKEVNSRLKKLS